MRVLNFGIVSLREVEGWQSNSQFAFLEVAGSVSKASRCAARPSAEGVPEIRGLAESHQLRDFVSSEFRGAEILFCQVAADIIENLSERCPLRSKLSVQRSLGGGEQR